MDKLPGKPSAASKEPAAAAKPSQQGESDDREVVELIGKLAAASLAAELVPKSALPPVRANVDPAIKTLAELLRTRSKVIVMCGAGISVSAGIPDFRSPGTGLYSQLAAYKLPTPEAIFELNYFRQRPEAFYKLCREMWPNTFKPTDAHRFIKLLHDKGKLLRCFTQNIDSLERIAGLPVDRVVAAHGNFDSATCIDTGRKVPIDEVEQCIKGSMPWKQLHEKHKVSRVKPDIVFFGEALPDRFFECAKKDFPLCDLLIVMGTSLQVHPFAGLVHNTKSPRVLINRDRVGPFRFGAKGASDFFFQGDCDMACNLTADLLGWQDDVQKL
jgi:NAD-dependent SIR2 family protein deacetylase